MICFIYRKAELNPKAHILDDVFFVVGFMVYFQCEKKTKCHTDVQILCLIFYRCNKSIILAAPLRAHHTVTIHRALKTIVYYLKIKTGNTCVIFVINVDIYHFSYSTCSQIVQHYKQKFPYKIKLFV